MKRYASYQYCGPSSTEPIPMTETTTTPTIVGREYKHGTYVVAKDGSNNDAVVIKEYITYSDGRRVPNLYIKENHKRPFWITLPHHRNHKDKKFSEVVNKLRKFESTQIDLIPNIARALGRGIDKRTSLRMLCNSPYVYGCDVTTPVLLKDAYQKRWPGLLTDNSIAALDIESDMFTERKAPIMVSLTMRDDAGHYKVFIAIVESFLQGIASPEEQLKNAQRKYLGDLMDSPGLQVETAIVEDPGKACYLAIMKAHEWKPDFLAIWNVNYDIKEINRTLVEYGYDPNVVFSDPAVPAKYRHFKYREGEPMKVTSSGKTMPLSPAEQWHVAECSASFYIIDSMCVYLKLRIAGGKESSYKLDDVLFKILGIRKLSFTEADHIPAGPRWHMFMQQNYKIEYCIYNKFDGISMLLLDQKITDLARQISVLSGPSEYERFPSQPRRTCDDLHFELLEKGHVIGSTSNKMEDENDKYTPSLNNWIVTLRSDMVADNGVQVIQEMPEYHTSLRAHVADLDVSGTYPNEQVLMNIEKSTTAREVCKINGKSEATQRAVGINLSGGYVNAVEICTAMYGAPTMEQVLRDFTAHIAGVEPEPDPHSTLSSHLQAQAEEYVMMIEEESEEDEDEEEEEMA